MATAQPWNQSKSPIATVNRQRFCTDPELQRKLRKVLSGKLGSLQIAIHDPTAQRVFLSLAVYSPEELLPQGVGSLVGNIGRSSTPGRIPSEKPEHLGTSLAITKMMNETQSPTARVIGAAVLSGINKGYRKVSFGTTQQVSNPGDTPGAVIICMQA